MAKILEGVFMASVTEVSVEKVGEKDTPMIKVHFQPISEKVGEEFKTTEGLPKVNRGYFLSLDLVAKGKHAGKSRVEALKADFVDSYGYEGGLNPDALSAIVGRTVELVCKDGGKGYTDVQYVNLPGQKKGRKPVKHLDATELAAFDKLWSGTPVAKPASASSLFASLTAGAGDKK